MVDTYLNLKVSTFFKLFSCTLYRIQSRITTKCLGAGVRYVCRQVLETVRIVVDFVPFSSIRIKPQIINQCSLFRLLGFFFYKNVRIM